MKLMVQQSETCEVLVGVFNLITPNGESKQAEFFVRCEGDSDDPVICARNMNAYNQQITDMWIELIDSGYKVLNYEEIEPFPLC